MLDVYHASLLVKATIHPRRLSRVVEARTLIAVCMRAVLVADVYHVLQLMRAAEDSRVAACIPISQSVSDAVRLLLSNHRL